MSCGSTDPRDAMGRCPNPKCRALRKGSQIASKQAPVNKARRDQLRASFLQDYRPSTTLDRVRCQELADLTERLSTIKKGSSEYARVVATMASLDVALRESRAMQQQQQSAPPIESLSNDALISRLETLLAAARGKQPEPPAIRRSDVDDQNHMGRPSQPICISSEIQTPETVSAETATGKAEEPLSDQSRAVGTIPTTPPATLPAESKDAVSALGLTLPSISPSSSEAASRRPSPIQPPEISDEEKERRAAKIRADLGWAEGVIGPNGLWRRHE